MSAPRKPLPVGFRAGLLTVVRELGIGDAGALMVLARCDCGAERIAKASEIRRRRRGLKSCGCLRNTANGLSRAHHAAYESWSGMHRRCENPACRTYKHYGGRGISVCERWRSFEVFLADMGDPPPGRSLDRIDNNGNYEPSNCRWATARMQRRNQRFVKLSFEKAEEIRRRKATGETYRSLAAAFGVATSAVALVLRGELWGEP